VAPTPPGGNRRPASSTASPVSQPLQTGLKSIDAMTAIGRGQRELIIGDRQTGKTTLAIDTILNQKPGDVRCVYVAIGQKMSTVAQRGRDCSQSNACCTTASWWWPRASDSAPLQYMAPFAGCAMAEYFRDPGRMR
jgi:F-type H+/Na+-transporting ATPase subunit alpha